jgi:hypothetical protein
MGDRVHTPDDGTCGKDGRWCFGTGIAHKSASPFSPRHHPGHRILQRARRGACDWRGDGARSSGSFSSEFFFFSRGRHGLRGAARTYIHTSIHIYVCWLLYALLYRVGTGTGKLRHFIFFNITCLFYFAVDRVRCKRRTGCHVCTEYRLVPCSLVRTQSEVRRDDRATLRLGLALELLAGFGVR